MSQFENEIQMAEWLDCLTVEKKTGSLKDRKKDARKTTKTQLVFY